VSRRRSPKTFVSLASALAVLALPAGGAAQTDGTVEIDRATNGHVIAELSHRETDNFRVKITRDGAVLYDRAIGGRCNEFCMATDSALTGQHIGFRDLDGTGEPEVIVDVHTGGTSCCVVVFAFRYDAVANRYVRTSLDTGAGFVVRDYDRDGLLELVGDDFRFRGLFTCGACGARPIRIWEYSTTRGFHVVTRSFRGRIRSHARRMRRLYARARRSGDAAFVKGALTPYTADLCLLDRCGDGLRLVRAALRRGELARRSPFDVSPLGREYPRALKRYLRRTGYLR
jgi:hypothetical protein